MGDAYSDHGHVVCNEAGEPYRPSTLTKLWSAAIRDLDVPQVRLHDSRHTCATLMHLENVPIAIRRVVGAHRRLLHTPHLRPRPARRIARGRTKPYPLTRQHRGLIRTPDQSWVEPLCKGNKDCHGFQRHSRSSSARATNS